MDPAFPQTPPTRHLAPINKEIARFIPHIQNDGDRSSSRDSQGPRHGGVDIQEVRR